MKYITLVLSIMLLGIATAWADQPVMSTWDFDWDGCPGEPDNEPLYDCGGGLFVCEAAYFYGVSREFYDKNGDLVRYVENSQAEGGLYELGNPDNFLPYQKITQRYEYDVKKDMASMTGPTGLIIVPGQGLVFQSVGRITAEGRWLLPPYTQEAGRHDWYHAFVFAEVNEAVCDYIASH